MTKILRSTGMVRRVDKLGRVVIPIEIRRSLGIEYKTPLEILINDDSLVLRKYVASNKDEVLSEINEIIDRAYGREDKRRLNELLNELLK